jgi:hypothetical protein
MQAESFGKIAVPTPGTPVRVTTNTNLRVARMRFAVVIGETGRVFLGVAGMNKADGTGVVKQFWPTGAGGGIADEFEVTAMDDRHLLVPSDYYVDANNANEGLIVAYWGR